MREDIEGILELCDVFRRTQSGTYDFRVSVGRYGRSTVKVSGYRETFGGNKFGRFSLKGSPHDVLETLGKIVDTDYAEETKDVS